MRVAVAEDVVLLREGIARVLRDGGFEVAVAVGDADALLEAVDATAVDVAIIDIRMPPTHTDEGLVAAEALRRADAARSRSSCCRRPWSRHTPSASSATGAAEIGYLLKERVAAVDDLLEAVERVARGGTAIDPAVVAALVARRRERDPLVS